MLGLFVNEWPEADGNMRWRFQRQGVENWVDSKRVSAIRVIRHLIPRATSEEANKIKEICDQYG